jgi:predicted PilT family ATPase
LNNPAVHVGEAEVSPLELVGQPGMIDAQQVQDRRVQDVDFDRVADDVYEKSSVSP